jgi:TadE-like protein
VGARARRAPIRRRDQRGAVTAETAMVLPVLVALTFALVWLVSLAVTQVRVVDAARETARAAAREDSGGRAVDLGRRVAPRGSTFQVSRNGDDVVVHVAATVRGPGGLFGFLPSPRLGATAVAAKEVS